jgi:hypothetical protein
MVATKSEELSARLHQEREELFKYSQQVDLSDLRTPERRPPLHIRVLSWILKGFF